MHHPQQLGTVFASRKMTLCYTDGGQEPLTLNVGAPYQVGDGGDWCCPYEIKTAGKMILRGMHGIDAIQALQLTMQILKIELQSWEISSKATIHFLDHPGIGL